MRTVSPHEMCDVLVKGIDRTNKSDRAISRETGTNYETVRNIRKRRHAPTAAVFFEFLLRYAEVRDVVDEYLHLKTKQQLTQKVPNVSPSVAHPQGASIRI
jgi:hypothetical protein